MRWKIWKVLAVFSVLVLLYARGSPISEHSFPKIPWTILFVLTLTFGISLAFSSKVPFHRRIAIAYLVFTGLAYLAAGVLGLLPHSDLIEAAAWRGLISPYLLISFLDQLVHRFPYTMARAPYETVPFATHQLFSGIVVAVSAVATGAAFAMVNARRRAYGAWLAVLGVLTVCWLGYVVVGAVSWGIKEAVLPLCWLLSYFAAYLMSRVGTSMQSPGTTTTSANEVDLSDD